MSSDKLAPAITGAPNRNQDLTSDLDRPDQETLEAWAQGLDAPPPPEKGSKKSLATKAAKIFANQSELFKSPDGKAFAMLDGTAYAVDSTDVKERLEYLMYTLQGVALSKYALEEAVTLLAGKAKFEGSERPIHLRVAETDDAIWIDLGRGGAGFVKVTQDGWTIAQKAPIAFRRPKLQRALPAPTKGGSVDKLRRFVNIDDDAFPLLIGWILSTFRPGRPCPIGLLVGEQGTSKSTTTRVMRRLSDPSETDLIALPKSEDDLIVAALHSSVIALDNISHMKVDMLDSLCRVCTGAGLNKRKLHTDADPIAFNVQRPIICNGINPFSERGDFAERSLVLRLHPIEKRITEAKFWGDFDAAAPTIFGALLDILSETLKRLPAAHVDELPRMADFALLLSAAAPSLGAKPEALVAAFKAAQQRATEEALESDPFVQLIEKIIGEKGASRDGARVIEAEPHEVYAMLRDRHQLSRAGDLQMAEFPKTPINMSKLLRRMAPQLRSLGFIVDLDGTAGRDADKRRVWRLGYV